jgi:hypothetical protein
MASPPIAVDRQRSRRTLVLLALVCIAPVVASYIAYYGVRPSARTNYGDLVAQPAPDVSGAGNSGSSFRLADLRGQWVLIVFGGENCDESCERKLYATRQARTIQGREQDRVVRLLVQPPGARDATPEWLASQPGLALARAAAGDWTKLAPSGDLRHYIFLLDPLGNVVLRYGDDPDIKRLAKDLSRLLSASRIG